jgi:hypothetical protein
MLKKIKIIEDYNPQFDLVLSSLEYEMLKINWEESTKLLSLEEYINMYSTYND